MLVNTQEYADVFLFKNNIKYYIFLSTSLSEERVDQNRRPHLTGGRSALNIMTDSHTENESVIPVTTRASSLQCPPWYQLGLVPSEIGRLCAHLLKRVFPWLKSYDPYHLGTMVHALKFAHIRDNFSSRSLKFVHFHTFNFSPTYYFWTVHLNTSEPSIEVLFNDIQIEPIQRSTSAMRSG